MILFYCYIFNLCIISEKTVKTSNAVLRPHVQPVQLIHERFRESPSCILSNRRHIARHRALYHSTVWFRSDRPSTIILVNWSTASVQFYRLHAASTTSEGYSRFETVFFFERFSGSSGAGTKDVGAATLSLAFVWTLNVIYWRTRSNNGETRWRWRMSDVGAALMTAAAAAAAAVEAAAAVAGTN